MIAKGTRGPHYKGVRIESTRQGGRKVIERWEGTQSEIAGLENGIASTYDGYHIERVGNSPVWTLEAFRNTLNAGGSAVTEVFELDINAIMQDCRFSPVLQGKLSRDQIIIVTGIYNRVREGKDDYRYSHAIESIDAQISGSNNGNARDFLDDLIAGVNHFLDFDLILRWTRSANRTIRLEPNLHNASKIYTSTAALISGEGMAGLLPWTLPQSEWLKLHPRHRAVYEGQQEVLYEYYAADVWSRNSYALAA